MNHPEMLYHPTQGWKKVKDATDKAAHQAAGFLTADEWRAAGPAPFPSHPATGVVEPLVSVPSDTPEESDPSDDPLATDAEKTELWDAPVPAITTRLTTASLETLHKVKAYEQARPKGARSTLLKAIDDAIAALGSKA